MKKIIDYLKSEKYSLIFEIIVVVIGMFLALTVDGIREDNKEKEKLAKTLKVNKHNLYDSYYEIKTQILEDTTNISALLEYTKYIDDRIIAYGTEEINANEFKECGECVLYVLDEVDFHIDLKSYRKISTLPLYTLNSAIFNDIEYTEENDSLFTAITDANTLINEYYFIVENYLHDNMEALEKDRASNIQYFKENVPQYFYIDATNLDGFDVTNSFYLNMLRARMENMLSYTENLNILLEGSKIVLASIDQAISALDNDPTFTVE